MNHEKHEKHEKILYKEECYRLQGAVYDIYKEILICYGKIIVELKAVKEIAPEHKAQLLNYLKATSMKLGLLINFGAYPKAQIIRMAS